MDELEEFALTKKLVRKVKNHWSSAFWNKYLRKVNVGGDWTKFTRNIKERDHDITLTKVVRIGLNVNNINIKENTHIGKLIILCLV